jgi:hypothetical protein
MKSKRFTQKRKKGGMFPRTRRKGNSPTTRFDFSLPSENESLKQEINTLTGKVDLLLKLVKTIQERTNNTHDFIDNLLMRQERARLRK